MWFRARNAWIRTENSGLVQQAAVAHSARALIHYHIVILSTFWEQNSRDRKKAALPIIFGDATYRMVDDLAESILEETSFAELRDERSLIRKANQIRFVCLMVAATVARYQHTIASMRNARNKAIAHNLISNETAPITIDVFQLRTLGQRTARICRLASRLPDGPLRRSGWASATRHDKSIEKYWTLLEADRTNWYR